MKLLCDAMLAHVGRKLRMAGYDTIIDEGLLADRDIVARARQDGRLLLTCDRKMEEHKGVASFLIYLPTNNEETWARHLHRDYGFDWNFNPLTRCLICNHELDDLPENKRDLVPKNLEDPSAVYCRHCDKAFWNGSHVSRMMNRLREFNSL